MIGKPLRKKLCRFFSEHFEKKKPLIAEAPLKDGIGRYVQNIKKYSETDVSYSKNILNPLNLFKVHFKYKVIHFPHFVTPLIKLPGQKYITTIQDITPLLIKDLNTIKRIYILLRVIVSLSVSDHLIFTSEFVQKCCHKILDVKHKSSVIPLGVDFNFFSQPRSPIYSKGPYFLIVGRRNKHKNLLNMLKAYAIAKVEPSMKIIITGDPKYEDRDLLDLISKLNIKENVIFWGAVSDNDLGALYYNAFALLFVSRFEGFGLPVLEAMAAGCLVITSKTSSLPAVAGQHALFADPEDVMSISKAIETSISLKNRARWIRKAQKRASEYSWQKTSDATTKVYKNFLEKESIND